MIIYNVTLNIDESIHDAWLQWMQEKHIQEVVDTGCFVSARLVRVLVDEEMGGITYSVQYYANTKEDLERYRKEFAPALQQEGMQLFGDKMLAFRTDLEVIKEFYSIHEIPH
ncbi:DUF4286 family protein [Capnocytophaga sp. ARDL2]|uniref:DUF4286 family protein n=1 Tax=Capnocytophaga sp. ARDL2 TaxID=3238809 RepID=UPI003556A675